MIRTTITLSTLALIAACTSPKAPTVSAADVGRAYAEADAIRSLPFTQTDDLPSGSVTYNGQLGADVRGDINGSILGDMRMDVDFGSNDITGDVTNINLIDNDGRPNQRLDGELDITGLEDTGRLDAFASGTLEGVEDGFAAETDVLLVLDGDVFTDDSNGDAVFGSATGDGIGDWNIEVDGVFFGRAD